MKPGVDGEVFTAMFYSAINTSPSTPGFILAIPPDES